MITQLCQESRRHLKKALQDKSLMETNEAEFVVDESKAGAKADEIADEQARDESNGVGAENCIGEEEEENQDDFHLRYEEEN